MSVQMQLILYVNVTFVHIFSSFQFDLLRSKLPSLSLSTNNQLVKLIHFTIIFFSSALFTKKPYLGNSVSFKISSALAVQSTELTSYRLTKFLKYNKTTQKFKTSVLLITEKPLKKLETGTKSLEIAYPAPGSSVFIRWESRR